MKLSAARTGWCITVLGAAFIAYETLGPEHQTAAEAAAMSAVCVICGDLGVLDAILNVLLFMPFGFGLRLAGMSRRRALLFAMASSFTIELLQYTVIPGRDGNVGDFIMNSVGGLAGIVLADSWRRVLFPGSAVSRAIRIAGGLVWLGLWSLSAFLLQPSVPATRWFAQVPSDGTYPEVFRGSVPSATLNGIALRSGPIPDGPALQERVLREGARLEAVAVLAAPTSFLASIVAVVDDHPTEILVFGQQRTDLVFRVLLRVPWVRLRQPTVRIPGILATAGDTVRLSAGFKDERYVLHARTRTTDVKRVVPLSPSWGWSFLIPWSYSLGPEGVWLTTLWIAGLLAPLGYYTSRESPRPTGALLFVGGVVLAGLAGVPFAAGMAPVHWSEWVAALTGIIVGLGLGRWSVSQTA